MREMRQIRPIPHSDAEMLIFLTTCAAAGRMSSIERSPLRRLSGCYASEKVGWLVSIDLLAAHDQLLCFDADVQFLFGKTGNGQRNSQALRPGCGLQPLDIIGRIAVAAARTPRESGFAEVEADDETFAR
jgi:hypothetical protein